MVDKIAIENGFSFSDVYFTGIFFGAVIIGPLCHCLFCLVDILLECLIRYRRENRPFRKTFLDILKYIIKP